MQEALVKTNLHNAYVAVETELTNAESEIILAVGTMAILQISVVCFLVIYLM